MTFTSEPNPLSHHPDPHAHAHCQQTRKQPKMIIQRQPQPQPQQQQQLNNMSPVQKSLQHHSTTNNAIDPVYLEDEEVFYNLIVKESLEQNCKQQQSACGQQPQLVGQQRHLLLSWMLKVCEHEFCEDDIFSLATMILDKFLLFRPIDRQLIDETGQRAFTRRRRPKIRKVRKKPFVIDFEQHHQFYCNEYNNNNNNSSNNISMAQDATQEHKEQANEGPNNREDTEDDEEEDEEEEIANYDVRDEELRRRQLYLFAACSLLLASKLRQTPRLCIQILIEFSKLELPIELTRDEILDAELLILSSLKWDLGSLVTPNDFLTLILRKCRTLLEPFSAIDRKINLSLNLSHSHNHDHQHDHQHQHQHHHHHHHHYHHYRRLSSPSSSPPWSSPSPSPSPLFDNAHQEADLDQELATRLLGRETTTTTTTTIVVVAQSGACLETPSALITPNSTPDDMIEHQQQEQQPMRQRQLANQCDEFKVKRHTQTLLELCLMDSQLSQYSPSILAMASMAVAIDGLSADGRICAKLNDVLIKVHEATHKVNELKLMIDVAHQIEKYVQKLLNSTRND